MSELTKQELEFNRNEDKMMQLVGQMNRRLDKIYEGGGKKRIDKEHEKGKLVARERVDYLSALLLRKTCTKSMVAARLQGL
jgi:3-methylcrotonyl-CoA carboxylase beta subunit